MSRRTPARKRLDPTFKEQMRGWKKQFPDLLICARCGKFAGATTFLTWDAINSCALENDQIAEYPSR